MDFVNEVNSVKKMLTENVLFMKSFEGTAGKFQEELKKLNDEMLKNHLELGENLIEMKTKQKRLDQILENASATSNTLEDFESKYEELCKAEENKRTNAKLTVEYKEFKAEICNNMNTFNAADNNDDDMVVEILEAADTACSMYDPWTKGLMVHPVRNIKCGHHYDRDSVMFVIKDKLSIRCPIVGCVSKCYIQPNHLEDDLPLLQRIKEHLAEQEAQKIWSSEDED